MRCENITLVKQVGKNGTNNEGLKKKLKFRGTYSIVSFSMYQKIELVYLRCFVYIGKDGMVEN